MYYVGLSLSVAAIYMIAGLGASLTLKTGHINLAGEGLIYTGGFLCAISLDFFARYNVPAFFAVSLALVFSALAGCLLMLFCEFLRKYKNADFLLTSFITSSAVIPLIDGLIQGPFRTKSGNLLATPYLAAQYRFASILKPSPLNGAIFAAIILCVLAGLFFKRTHFGKMTQVYGISPEFSLYSGFPCGKITFTAAGASGALHSLAGAIAICGTYYTCHSGFYSGMGWNALSVAMLAKTKSIRLIPFAIFMAALMTYSSRFALYSNLDFDVNSLIQAIILFMISIPFLKNVQGGKKHA